MAKYAILAQKVSFQPLSESRPAKRESFDPPDLAQKVSSIVLCGSGCKISMKNSIKVGQYDQICDFGLKIVILGPFKSLSLGGEKILTIEIGLNKSLVFPS